MSDRGLIIAIVGVGAALGSMILATDDGAKIDALDAKIDARIDALDAKIDARIDALDAKIDDIRVFIAAKHGETVSFTPGKQGGNPTWSVASVDPNTGKRSRIGTLVVRGKTERRAVLEIDDGRIAREWTHLGTADTLERARALIALSRSN